MIVKRESKLSDNIQMDTEIDDYHKFNSNNIFHNGKNSSEIYHNTIKGQQSLGFSKSTVVYCSKCQLKYNKINPQDIKFHVRIHKSKALPNNATLIGNGFYQKGASFYLAEGSEILASCNGRLIKRNTNEKTAKIEIFYVTSVYAISLSRKENLFKALQSLYPEVENFHKEANRLIADFP